MKQKIFFPENIGTKILNIDFGIVKKQDIRKYSVLKVNKREIYDINTEKPMIGGVLDTKLGLSMPGGTCNTCNKTLQDCFGHFGHIELTFPVFNSGYQKQLIKILQAICKKCARITVTEEKLLIYSIQQKNIFNDEIFFNEAKKNKLCPHCNYTNMIVKKGIGTKIIFAGYDLNPISVKNLLLKVKDSHLLTNISKNNLFLNEDEKLNISDGFIVDEILVPPSNTRPSVKTEEFGSNEDSLTIKLSELVQLSTTLLNSLSSSSLSIIQNDWELLNETFNTYICGSNLRSLLTRLKGKNGRFRNNLSGKRSDFTARTVISPDPLLSVEQVGNPLRIAKNLTVKEKVNNLNYERLKKCVLNGKRYPGANYVITKNNKRLSTTYNKKISIGDIVERHLIDDDKVLFNRQPSLHRQSILAHKVKIVPNKTFCFNVSVCGPYNADFDGDEMNIHVPQTIVARSECEILSVKNNLRTPKDNSLIIMPNQDFITSVYLFGGDFFEKEVFFQYLNEIYNTMQNIDIFKTVKPSIYRPKKLFSGKQILKILFPNYDQKTLIDKKLLKKLLSQLSNEQIVKIENSISRISAKYIGEKGFSFGIDDLIYKHKDNDSLENCMNTAILNASPNNIAELSSIRDKIAQTINLKYTNSALVMAESGSKGSKINITQMVALVGQQVINGQLVPLSFGGRSLPHFDYEEKNIDKHIETDTMKLKMKKEVLLSRGFIKNSFFSGLNPYELFFHAISGREGLVDTAVKTAETGYLQRRLIKALEDLRLCFDGSIRGVNCILQYPNSNSNYFKKGFVPGDAVGAIAAQSIGEPGTQMTLKTFHFAGVGSMNITLGVPRLKEIINASACSTPIIKINGLNKQLNPMREINDSITSLCIENVITCINFNICNVAYADLIIKDRYIKYTELIKDRLEKRYKQQISILNNCIRIFFNVDDDLIFNLTDFEQQVGKIFLHGIKTITNTTLKNIENIQNNNNVPYFDLIAEGNGLIDILGLENVESAITNDVLEIYSVLGIEAAQKTIVEEIIFTLQNHGIEINSDHIILLADLMCSTGKVAGITRFGIKTFKSNTLMLASFEQTGDHLFDAALNRKSNPINGVSDSIIVGEKIPLGTGEIQIIHDYTKS